MNKVLPVKYPVITSYTHHANILSILGCYDEPRDWIYSNYIQLYCNKDFEKHGWGDFYFPMPYESKPADLCRWLLIQKINRNDVINSEGGFLQFLINAINKEQYLHLFVDYYYIMENDFDHKEHFNHDIMIYGYDEEKQVFNCADFLFKNGEYSYTEVSFDNIKQAATMCQNDYYVSGDYLEGLIELIHYKDNFTEYEFDVRNIVNNIRMYCNSSKPEYYMMYNAKNGDEIVFGMEIYDALIRYIKTTKFKRIDYRMLYVLYDHKRLMKLRFEFMQEKSVLKRPELLASLQLKYDTYADNLMKIIRYLVKFNFTKSKHLKEKAIEYLEFIKKDEYQVLSEFLKDYTI